MFDETKALIRSHKSNERQSLVHKTQQRKFTDRLRNTNPTNTVNEIGCSGKSSTSVTRRVTDGKRPVTRHMCW